MGSRVLVVDDDPEIARGLRDAVAGDVSVDEAAEVMDAIALLEKHQYCGLVLDLVLRESSGFDILRYIGEKELTLPTIVVTGKLPSYVREMLNAEHVKLVFPKPVDPRLLGTIVQGLCSMSS